ncbi:MAG: Holliday junction resolvase RuvX [Saprospiraceae bacterium]|nr:Holliday junction resolvase RuvX [Saprospiraceae bacterium]
MARILGIDYGMKRCGIAATDPMQIIVTGLNTIEESKLLEFISVYLQTEEVEKLVIGRPQHADGTDTYLMKYINKFCEVMKQRYPNIPIELYDERKTSIQAAKIIFDSGIPKSKRQNKELIDKVSAVLILQKYLGHI